MRLAILSKKTRGGTVFAQIRLDFGDEKSLFGKNPTAQLLGALLIRGTKNKSRQQIQDEMDKLKARIGVGGTGAYVSANIETTEENLPGALRLVAEVLREPLLAEDEFEKLKQQRIAGIEANKSEPGALASIELQRRLNPYPRGDIRYTGTIEEQLEDVKKGLDRRCRASSTRNSTARPMANSSSTASAMRRRCKSWPPNFSAHGKAPAPTRA